MKRSLRKRVAVCSITRPNCSSSLSYDESIKESCDYNEAYSMKSIEVLKEKERDQVPIDDLVKIRVEVKKEDIVSSSERDQVPIDDLVKKRVEVKKEDIVSSSDDSEIENQSPVKKMKGDDYLKMIERNRQRSMAFLQSLKIDEVKKSLCSSVNALKPKRSYAKKYDKRKIVLLPSRKSARLAKQNLSEDSIEQIIKEAKPVQHLKLEFIKKKPVSTYVEPVQHLKLEFIKKTPVSTYVEAEAEISNVKKERPKKFGFSECMLEEDNGCDFLKDYASLQSDFHSIKTRYPDDFERMESNESCVSKVVPSRITALTIHPSSKMVLVTAGSKQGHIGFWNLTSNSSNSFYCHTQGVTDVKYNGFNVCKLMSSSYDGTLLCGDMEKLVFEKYYETKDDCCTAFDILSHTTFLVGHNSGEVAIVDSLAKKNAVKRHVCHDYKVKGLTIHPVNKNYFATSEIKGPIKVWDLRKLTAKPLCETNHHSRSVSSVYFSPVTGNTLLSTSTDDQCCIFDTSDFSKGLPVKKSIPHNNQTGRWLTPFKALWVPNTSDELFAIGSMKYPRRIEVLDQQGKLVHNFMDENLSTVLSLLAFHPLLPILAGGNSSGRVTVLQKL